MQTPQKTSSNIAGDRWLTRSFRRDQPMIVLKQVYYSAVITVTLAQTAGLLSPSWLQDKYRQRGLFYYCYYNAENGTYCHPEMLHIKSQATVMTVLGLEILSSLSGLVGSIVIAICLSKGVKWLAHDSQTRKHAHFLCVGSGSLNAGACILFLSVIGDNTLGTGYIICLSCALALVLQVIGLLFFKKPEQGR